MVRNRMNKAIELVRYPAVPHNDNPYAAHTGAALVGCLKIYCCKIFLIHKYIPIFSVVRYKENTGICQTVAQIKNFLLISGDSHPL